MPTAVHTYLLHHIFNTLIDSFISDKVGVTTNFLNAPLAAQLSNNLTTLYADNQFKNAGTGNDTVVSHDKLMRSDMIYWLDKKHNDQYENAFFDLMDQFVLYLNEACYTGITGYEFHYALYDTGSFYKKHLDQFRTNDSRKYSLISYLNTNWKKEDGGELCIHHPGSLQHIAPENGTTVFFKSNELLHEVLLTNKPRLSITGWLKVN
ncbi:MAG: 2OG-Fe(II) oxygenase [Ferruginibacter sp.]